MKGGFPDGKIINKMIIWLVIIIKQWYNSGARMSIIWNEESKTTKYCWWRGTDPVLPLNFYPSVISPISYSWSLYSPFFIFFPSEDVVFPSEDIVWIIIFHDTTKWFQDWLLNHWFKYCNHQTIPQMRCPRPPYSILLVLVSIVQC